MELWIQSSTCRMVFQLVLVDSRKRRGHASGIRHAHGRAPLSSESIRVAGYVAGYKDRARARHSTPAHDCACVRTCDRSPPFPTTPVRRKRRGLFRESRTEAFRKKSRTRFGSPEPRRRHTRHSSSSRVTIPTAARERTRSSSYSVAVGANSRPATCTRRRPCSMARVDGELVGHEGLRAGRAA